MPKRVIDAREGHAFFNLVSHPRGGPGRKIHLSRAQIEQIARTVRRVPEVVIKVLPKDNNSARAIQKHIDYIGRKGKLELETDDGARLQGRDAGKQLLDDWDLDLEAHGRETEFSGARGRRASKLVHKLVFSMPPGTPPKGVLTAVRNFALEKFALQHRYAMVLHTDEPHPHVHVVVKAVSEMGIRLNIDRDTLREWRARFAYYLREEGIAANATDRFVRGRKGRSMSDGVYRATMRGASTYIGQQPSSGEEQRSALKHQYLWRLVGEMLQKQGYSQLAREAHQFSQPSIQNTICERALPQISS
jgi:hypothetical protein